MRRQAGFTLIELVVVLVLLGILGAVATAQFQDLGTQAADAAAEATAAEITTGGAINFAMDVANGTGNAPGTTVNTGTEDCETYAGNMLQDATVLGDMTIAGGPVDCGAGAGTTGTCTISHDSGTAATFNFLLYCTDD